MPTALDNEDWESQLEQMMGERDATDVADTFRKIIDAYDDNEPAATLEIMVGEDDIHAWLPALKEFLDKEDVSGPIGDMLWNLGLQLCQAYMTNDDVAPMPACTEAVKWFMDPDNHEVDGYADDDDDDD